MEWENTPKSANVEDRRGQGGGGGGRSGGGGGLGIGAIIIIFAISYFTGINPAVLLGGAEMVGAATPQRSRRRDRAPPSTRRPDAQTLVSPRARRDRGGLGGSAARAEGREIRRREAGAL